MVSKIEKTNLFIYLLYERDTEKKFTKLNLKNQNDRLLGSSINVFCFTKTNFENDFEINLQERI